MRGVSVTEDSSFSAASYSTPEYTEHEYTELGLDYFGRPPPEFTLADVARRLEISRHALYQRRRQAEKRQFPDFGRICDSCKRKLPEGYTSRRRFCSGACRVANHRRARST